MSTKNSKVNDSSPTATLSGKSDLFVFGDSLSDIGNLFRKSNGFLPLTFPPPTLPYSEGRQSNGDLAVQILAEQLGYPLAPETDAGVGNNFAIGGAGTDRTNLADGFLPFLPQVGGLLDQIDQFKANASNLGAGAEDVYIVWAGANDFLKFLADPPPAPETVISAAINNLVTSVQTLIGSGAKNILVAKVPDLSLIPLVINRTDSVPAQIKLLAQNFNAALQTAMDGLAASFPNSNIILSDTFTRSNEVAQDPGRFGFTNTRDPLNQNPTATNPEGYFFWDDFHPTTQGHGVFANLFRNDLITGITDDFTRKGTAEPDRLVGFSGNDSLDGKAGKDYLEGNPGRDSLLGGADNDTLVGGDNRDRLTGGLGRDALTGGEARDQFIYNKVSEGRDRIEDFEVGKDRIDVAVILSKPNYDRSNRFEAYIRLAQTDNGAVVKVDGNGDRSGGFKPLALLEGVNANDLGRSSFVIGGQVPT